MPFFLAYTICPALFSSILFSNSPPSTFSKQIAQTTGKYPILWPPWDLIPFRHITWCEEWTALKWKQDKTVGEMHQQERTIPPSEFIFLLQRINTAASIQFAFPDDIRLHGLPPQCPQFAQSSLLPKHVSGGTERGSLVYQRRGRDECQISRFHRVGLANNEDRAVMGMVAARCRWEKFVVQSETFLPQRPLCQWHVSLSQTQSFGQILTRTKNHKVSSDWRLCVALVMPVSEAAELVIPGASPPEDEATPEQRNPTFVKHLGHTVLAGPRALSWLRGKILLTYLCIPHF